MIARHRALQAALECAREAGWDTTGANAVRWEECPRPPAVFSVSPPEPVMSHWVVYFPWQGTNQLRIQQIQVAIVHGGTGTVLHLGGAGDEG